MSNEEQRLPPGRERRRLNGSSLSAVAFVGSGCLLLTLVAALLFFGPPVSFSTMHLGGASHSAITLSTRTNTAVSFTKNTGTDQSTIGDGSLSWPVGASTYWANARYHVLSGYWVSWYGSPSQWVEGARAAGWHVSQTPHMPSIVILMPGVQGAGEYGHAAVLESIVARTPLTVVSTSNMQWYTNGGGWNIVSYANFNAGAGVYFIWH